MHIGGKLRVVRSVTFGSPRRDGGLGEVGGISLCITFVLWYVALTLHDIFDLYVFVCKAMLLTALSATEAVHLAITLIVMDVALLADSEMWIGVVWVIVGGEGLSKPIP